MPNNYTVKSNNMLSNLVQPKNVNSNIQQQSSPVKNENVNITSGEIDTFKKTYADKKEGLIARAYVGIRKLFKKETSRSVIEKLEKGKITKEEATKSLNSIENTKKDLTNMILGAGASIVTLLSCHKLKNASKLLEFFTKTNSKTLKVAQYALPFALGLITRGVLKVVNQIPADKQTKKENKFGMADSIMSCIDSASGLLMTASPILIPVGFAMGAAGRYFCRKSKDKDNNVNLTDFIDSQKSLALPAILTAGVVALSAVKGHLNANKLAKAFEDAKVNLKHLNSYNVAKERATEFQSLARDLGFDLKLVLKENGDIDPKGFAKLDKEMMQILLEKGQNGNIEHKMRKLEEMNIFLPKYFQTLVDISDNQNAKIGKQIDSILEGRAKRQSESYSILNSDNWLVTHELDKFLDNLESENMDLNGFKDIKDIIQKIKSHCPTSRTVDEAQQIINDSYGAGKYNIIRGGKKDGLLGVGSIAESYLAKDHKGNEVVIKIVKKHFSDGTKVDKDLNSTLNKLESKSYNGFTFDPKYTIINNPERKEYDINQLKNMYQTWGNETNLANEAISASEIGEQASKYSAVKVIDSQPSIYVMEKAKGIQLDSDNIAELWKKEGLTEEDFKNFVQNYINVYCEQLFSLPEKGMKVVQSDPHGGNILVDLSKVKELRNAESHITPITIIDYGNTTKTTRTVAAKNLFSHLDYLIGNTDGIAKSVLEGADFKGKNKADIIKNLSEELKGMIYNSDTKIDVDNPVEIFRKVNAFCLDYMQSHNIIPNASHINQMKAEETYILSNLGCLLKIAEGCNYDLGKALDRKEIINQIMKEMSTSIKSSLQKNPIFTIKELFSRVKHISDNTEDTLTALGGNLGLISA